MRDAFKVLTSQFLAALIVALPAWARGQLPASSNAGAERTAFYLISHAVGGTDTIVRERSTRTATELSGEFLASNGGRLTYAATLASDSGNGLAGLISRLETRSYRGGADTTGVPATFVVGGDSIIARMGTAVPAHIPSTVGTLIVLNPSMAFFEQMLIRAKAIGPATAGATAAIPVFIVGAPAPVRLVVTWIGADSATLDYAGVTIRLAVSPTGHLLGGAMPERNLTIARGPAVDALVTERRDYSAPPGAPYAAEEVVVHTPSGLRLSGTLTIPRARLTGQVPAVVTITGSGAEDRDEEPVGALHGYRPFRQLADTLGRRGIAVLRLDDRGVNGSDAGPPTATSRDFADDIRAGVAYLRTRPEIDPTRIALVGHSEGGIIAPMVASTDPALRAMVLMAATASPGRAILLSQQHYAIDTMAHLTGAQRDAALAQSARATDSMAAVVPWMKLFLDYDPSVLARQIRTPVLILEGLTDHQVPASESAKLAAAFRAGGNDHVTVRTFPATNHLFIADETGSFDYAKLPSLRVRPEVLGAIADWLSEQFR